MIRTLYQAPMGAVQDGNREQILTAVNSVAVEKLSAWTDLVRAGGVPRSVFVLF